MVSKMTAAALAALALAAFHLGATAGGAWAESQGGGQIDHGSMDHSSMSTPTDVDEVTAQAVIHSVDAEGGMVTLTHDPVEALGWPQMTMDLPVSKRVDLAAAPLEQPVTIVLKKGRDNVFRVMEIKPGS